MTKRYECKLSPALLAKAVEELNEPEDNIERLAAIDSLKGEFKKSNPDISLLNDDDEFILRFLRAKKFVIPKALTTLTNYHKKKEVWPEVVEKVENPTVLSSALSNNLITKIDGNAKNGSYIVVGFPGSNDVPLPDFFSCVILSLEKMLEDEEFQIHGLTVIEDLTYFGTNMMKYLGPSVSKKFLSLVQEALPVRIKSLNMVNEPTIFNVIYAIIRPFLKEKMRKRLQVIGTKYETLHLIVSPEILPERYLGSGKSLNFDKWKESLLGEDTAL